MKILHITPSYKPAFVYGGPTLSVSQLCEHQAAIGEEVAVICTTANGLEELPVGQSFIGGVNVQYFKRITGDHTHFSPSLLWYLWQHAMQYNVVHIHSWWNLVSVLATLVCWLKGVKPVLSPRGMLSHFSFTQDNSIKKKLIHNFLGKWLLKNTLLHATSQLEWQDAHRVYPAWKGFILPNIIDLPEGQFARPAASDTLKLIFLSRVHPKKGLELTLKALAQCDFPFQLEIYGDGEESYIQNLKTLVANLGISSSVAWKGWVNGKTKYKALADADIFILTSYNENFANVVLESLAVGTPVLLSDQVGLADYVERKNLGWVCALEAEEIVEKLSFSHDALKSRSPAFTINSETVKNEFQANTLARQYLQQYYTLKRENVNE